MVFAKAPFRVTERAIPLCCLPAVKLEQVDYEGELAVLLGRDAKDVAVEDALSYVAGYAAANDITARWWQKHDPGGSLSVARALTLSVRLVLGDRQKGARPPSPADRDHAERRRGARRGHGGHDFFGARHHCPPQPDTTLPAGTVLLTGTPSGVGPENTAPLFAGRRFG